MKPGPALAFALIVLLPLGALAWLGVRAAEADKLRAEAQLESLLRSNLEATTRTLTQVLDETRAQLAREFDGQPLEGSALRARARRLPLVRQLFVLDPASGLLSYPSLLDPLDREEDNFLRRTRDLWLRRAVSLRPGEAASGAVSGFHAWRYGSDLHLLCFWKDTRGPIVGAELERVRWLALLIDSLPDTAAGETTQRMRLVDGEGQRLYEWGAYEPPADQRARVRVALQSPLQAISLEAFVAPTPAGGARLAGFLPWLALFATLLLGLATYFYRESTRDVREAQSRVSFVNRVSHELKTPLTNIRLYAELLDQDPELGESERRYLGVILSESQRLSRLIKNVLTFGRAERRELRLARQPGALDETVRGVVRSFTPALTAAGLDVRLELGGTGTLSYDPDAVEQVLANLLSNVEKYAVAGGTVEIATSRDARRALVSVRDHGAGIPGGHAERIFQPFYRLSNAITEGKSGTGIGLSIARELARAHGGELWLDPEIRDGARFVLALPVGEVSS